MNLLSQSTALQPGADLWVVPQYEESHWTGKIDWMLNFIILKNLRHENLLIQPEMHQFIQETEFPAQKQQELTPSKMLLVLSDKLIPSKWVIHHPIPPSINNNSKLKPWIKQILLSAKSLQAMSLRVFIPKSIATTEFFLLFEEELRSLKYPLELSFVNEGTGS